MEIVISALTTDLVGRFISFLTNKYSDRACSEEKQVDKLQQLLLRVHTVVEEADGKHITNSGMLMQLKMLVQALYHGYYALDTLKCNQLIKEGSDEDVSGLFPLYLATPLKRFRANAGKSSHKVGQSDLQGALLNLETVVSNMTEFVIVLGGYERMFRRPYDTYLYLDNFMFGRHIEKQQVLRFLLQHDPLGAPAVLPIIGDYLAGKKTLVAHVCNDEKVHGNFSSILRFNGDNFCTIDHDKCSSGRTLIVVTFVSDVDDEDWKKFYRSVTCMNTGSKVIIISRIESSVRFGTVKPIHLSSLPHEEYSYLFKVLSFGSTNTDDHPHLASMEQEFPMLLNGSFISAYAFAEVLRKNTNIQFWLSILTRYRNVIESNLIMYGEHPKLLLERDRPTDISKFVSPSAAPLLLMPRRSETDVARRSLPTVTFEELIVDPSVLPKGDFDLVRWESRVAPYTKHFHFVLACAQENTETLSTRRKRRALFM